MERRGAEMYYEVKIIKSVLVAHKKIDLITNLIEELLNERPSKHLLPPYLCDSVRRTLEQIKEAENV